MSFLLKPKRYGMNKEINPGRLYNSSYHNEPYRIYPGCNETNIILLNELDVVKFLRSRITEDLVDCTQRRFYETYKRIASDFAGKSFRELTKNNCKLLKCGKHANDWSERQFINSIGSSPWNYKLFKLETVVSHGVHVQRQIPMTWSQFLQQCEDIGIGNQCVYKELP